ncbi:MAG: hypothetical protein INH41_22670 [Myxococcaceae bacterium]|nr:hypothetical protein [Myxococcaceae bacterium]
MLANISLHVLDAEWERKHAHLGVLVRYADDVVIACSTRAACKEAERHCTRVMGKLDLPLHPEKTRRVDLSLGRQGFDFLGCHLRKKMSGPLWERERTRVSFLQRWPSLHSMKRVCECIPELTPRGRCHEDLRSVIETLNPVLQGGSFRLGNASQKYAGNPHVRFGRGSCSLRCVFQPAVREARATNGRHLETLRRRPVPPGADSRVLPRPRRARPAGLAR